ncbi:MAG: CHAT domain-containing protein [Bacteroidales bacterium]|nr:CHAT domain-containing protein [Bacteroidales bacterium]
MIKHKKNIIFILIILLVLFVLQDFIGNPNHNIKQGSQIDFLIAYKDSAAHSLDLGDYRKSLFYLQKSHENALKIYESDDVEIAKSLVNLANAYSRNWDYDTALIMIKKAEDIYLRTENIENATLGYLYSSIGNIYKNTGDYYHATEYYNYASGFLHKETRERYMNWEALLYIRFSMVKLILKEYSESLDYLEKAYTILRKLPDNSSLWVTYYINKANTYAGMDKLEKSIELQQKAIDFCRKYLLSYSNQLIILYNNIGLDYIELGNYDTAEEYFIKGIDMQKDISERSENFAELHESLASLYQRRGEYRKALGYYQSALKIVSSGFASEDIYANPKTGQLFSPLLALKILKSKSVCLDQLYDKEGSLEFLDAAIASSLLQIEVIESMRNSYQSFEAKLQIAEHESSTYSTTLELANKAFRAKGDITYGKLAFEISEKSRSSVLLSAIRELDAREFGKIPRDMLNMEKRLLKDIAFYKESIYEEQQQKLPDTGKIKMWEKYLFEAQRSQEKLIGQLEQKYPDYYQLKYNTTVITPEKLQNQLAHNASIIEYCIMKNVLHTYVITSRHFHLITTPIDSNFLHIVNEYLNEYHLFDYSEQSYSGYTQFCWNSKNLYDLLIQPVRKYIKGENLMIVPEGILSFLPFETLIEELPDSLTTGYYKDLDYLLYDYNISYSYSSTLFSELEQKSSRKKIKKLLAFAPEYSADPLFSVNNKTPVTRQNKYRKDLYPIPGVIEEVNSIKNLIPSDVYLGKDATETNFRNTAEKYDILHLAMHTVIDNENPMFSKLIFTLGEDSLNDGLLNTYEIFSLKLKAQLVVLSACSTGEGSYKQGEGVMSLARSFAYAGTPSMLMTLWEVEDRSGVKLMKDFYTYLLKGKSKSEAMRYAKMQFIEYAKPENSHPFFWSAYITMGNNDALFNSHCLPFVYIITGIAIAVVVLVMFPMIKKRTSNLS